MVQASNMHGMYITMMKKLQVCLQEGENVMMRQK